MSRRMSSKVTGGSVTDKESRGGTRLDGNYSRSSNQHNASKCVPQTPSSPPINPPSSPIPLDAAVTTTTTSNNNNNLNNNNSSGGSPVDDVEDDELDVDVEDEDEQPLDDLDDIVDDDENSPDLNHPHNHTSDPAANNSASSYNSPIFLGSSSEEDDDDGEADESLERDESDEDDDDDDGMEPPGFLLPPDADSSSIQGIPPDAQARLEAFFEAAGFTDGKLMSDPENLRKLTLTVSSALGEASAAINRMRDSQRKSLEEGRNDSMEEGDSLLALACSSGYFELARVLLAMGANVDDRGSKGDLTPLMDASSQGHIEIVRLLLSHGADVNAQSACGNSPLMYACAAGHEDIVKELLKAGARVEDNNENGHTPLMEAASAGHVGVAKILLDHGAGINTHSNEFKESALTVACYKGHLEMVRFLLEAGADQQHKTDEMHTALMEASMDGHVEVARLLLDSGAQVNMPADSFESPLTLASCGGHVELAELLIERGANVEEVNDEGYTPLMEAAREGHLKVVKSLLRNNAKINAQTEETHETALTLAACGGFRDVVDTLVCAGADIELGASTPLMEASQEGQYQIVKYLLDKGADLRRETQTGDTALSYACENGHVDVVELLIERGANPEHLSEGGRNPLMKACRGGHLDVIKFLLSKGADVNRQTASNDHTPLSLACAGGHIAAVEVLLAAGANPFHKLKDNSTMIIEAARGGHTNVIRALLESQECRGGVPEKITQGKATKGQATTTSNSGSNQNQGKSVLRKSRSTSTLDSSAPQQQKPVDTAGSGEGGSAPNVAKPKSGTATSESLHTKNLHMTGDGIKKQAMSMAATAAAVNQANSISMAEVKSISTASAHTPPTRKTAVPSASSSNSGISCSSQPGGFCPECAKASSEGSSSNHQHVGGHAHVKRPVETLPPGNLPHNISPLTLTTSGTVSNLSSSPVNTPVNTTSSTSNTTGGTFTTIGTVTSAAASTTPSTGPPLVPSQELIPAKENSNSWTCSCGLYADPMQVTAATAISERPKAKAQRRLESGLEGGVGIVSSSTRGVIQELAVATVHCSNKPSARKQVQLQQQLQHQLQQQQLQHQLQQQQATSSAGTSGAGTGSGVPVVSSSSTSSSQAVQPVTPTGTLMPIVDVHLQQQPFVSRIAGAQLEGGIKLPVVPNSPPTKMQMHVQQVRANQTVGNSQFKKLDPQQLTQIFAQHQQQILKGEKVINKNIDPYEHAQAATQEVFDLSDLSQVLAAAGSYNSFSALATTSGTSQGLGSQLAACTGSGVAGATTTTTTTTVVVTHGNGETETIIEGENLPPGANEMILNAAAASFPLDFPLQGALQLSPTSGVHVQSYQLSAAAGLGTDLSGAAVGMPTMQTTTIINSSSGATSFSPPILLPHPPQIKEAIVAGLATPSGPVSSKSSSTTMTKNKAVQEQSTTIKAMNAVGTIGGTIVKGPSSNSVSTQAPSLAAAAAAAVGTNNQQQQQSQVKKPTAAIATVHCSSKPNKRSRPFCPQVTGNNCNQQPRQSNQQTQTLTHSATGMKQNQSVASTQTTFTAQQEAVKKAINDKDLSMDVKSYVSLDVNSSTESNGETSLSIAAASGHLDVVEFLISKGAHIEHRDKKGCTPLILAADGGHEKVVELLLNAGAEIEAQSERTKDTALSLACTKGRYEVVDFLLKRGANKEHRNVSDYTPLSLAASGGYVNIIKLLLQNGAEINSRTGSKLGISPLMLAAMNGNTQAVKLLLDMGSDINAQIETNKNTALTLACFQGRQEVVQLLLERKANLEHRAKTGLTPLMEAANGGYVEVGKVLLDKGADVNAPPVPATRDTALTIAADKGHYRFVELLLQRGALVDVRNKKGCTPLWLACHGGHLDVGQILMRGGADMDAQDNRRISCLMAAFRKGHVKVIRWIVKNVTQFPSDAEMSRYILSVANEPELLKRCQQCAEYVKQAKDKQALEANKNASILLEELDMERSREESKKLAAARRREKKKKKKLEKKQLYSGGTSKGDEDEDDNDDDDDDEPEILMQEEDEDEENGGIIDSGIDANSLGSNSSTGNNHNIDGSKRNRKGNKENLVNDGINQLVQPPLLLEKTPQEKQLDKPGGGKSRKKNKNKKQSSSHPSSITTSLSQTKEEPKADESSQQQSPPKKKEILKEKVEVAATDSVKQMIKAVVVGSTAKDQHNKKSKEEPIPVENKLKKNQQSPASSQQSQALNETTKFSNSHSPSSHLAHSQIISSSSSSSKKVAKGSIDNSSSSQQQQSQHQQSGPEPLMGIALNPSQLRKNTNFDHSVEHSQHQPLSSQPHSSHTIHSHYQSGGGSGSKHLSSSTSSGGGGGGASSLSQKQLSRKDEGWKEVTRSCPSSRSKKINVPSSVISRVIGRGGCNINAIREATGAHIEVEKQQKGQIQPERIIQIKGSAEATKQAFNLITVLMNEPDSDSTTLKKLLGAGVRLTASNTLNSLTSSLQINPSVVTTGGVSSSSNGGNLGLSSSSSSTVGASIVSPLPVSGNSVSVAADVILPSAIKPLVGGAGKTPKSQQSSKIPASPPIIPPKNSPSIKKPTPVVTTSSNAASIKAVSSGKRSMIVTPSQNSTLNQLTNSNSNSTSFAAKLSHQQQQTLNSFTTVNPPTTNTTRNATPTPTTQSQQHSQQQQTKPVTPTPNDLVLLPLTPPPTEQQQIVTGSQQHQVTPVHSSLRQTPTQLQQQITRSQLKTPERQQQLQQNIQNPTAILVSSMLGGGNQNKEHISLRSQNGAVLSPQQQQGFSQQQQQKNSNSNQPATNLAPGSGVNVLNKGNNSAGGIRSTPSIENSRVETSTPSGSQTPLEYSPFNYTFSKTTGWFQGDLAQPYTSNSSGLQQPSMNPILSGSNVARAMNFASVAASGISSSSMSTTTAQMTQAGGGVQNGNVVGSLVAGLNLAGPSAKNLVDAMVAADQLDVIPKADASKAPGYRGNTSMGSPVLRMQQQQQAHPQQNSPFNVMDGHLSHFASLNSPPTNNLLPNMNNHGSNVLPNQNTSPNLMTSFSNRNHPPQQPTPQQATHVGMNVNHAMVQQPALGSAFGHHGVNTAHAHSQHNPSLNHQDLASPISGSNAMIFQQNNSGGPVAGVPSNVVISSRLNPRAPSFNLPLNKQQQPPLQPTPLQQPPPQNQPPQQQPQQPNNNNSSVSSAYQSIASIHHQQQFKNMGAAGQQQASQFGRPGRPGTQPQGGWGGYGNAGEHVVDFQGLAALANAGGAIDPQTLLSSLETSSLHDNQNALNKLEVQDRRLPRPIGGERAWKNTGNTGGGFAPFATLDCLDTSHLPQSIPIAPHQNNVHGGHNMGPASHQGQPWLNMYGTHGSSNQQAPLQSHGPPPPPPPNRDPTRNFLGRRFIEEDANRLLELQQMYEGQQRLMNGSGGVPPMMQHMGGQQPPMYPFGLEHLEPHVPKVDQSWGETNHLNMMDDNNKHMGWGQTNKWGN